MAATHSSLPRSALSALCPFSPDTIIAGDMLWGGSVSATSASRTACDGVRRTPDLAQRKLQGHGRDEEREQCLLAVASLKTFLMRV